MMVSVIMITYGHEKYIKQAIEGVLMQECNFSYELIIANDCSPDDTDIIVNEVISTHPKASIIKYTRHKKNKGMNANFEWAFNQTDGKYIAICEGDDYWTDKLKLQKQVNFLELNSEFAGSAHQSLIISSEDNSVNRVFSFNAPNVIKLNDLLNERIFHTASLLFRKKIIEKQFLQLEVLSADKALFMLITNYGPIKFFTESMCVYRKHKGGISNSVSLTLLKQDLNIIPWMVSLNKFFPKYRFKSYLYKTLASNKSDILFILRIYYFSIYFILSFSYFPRNVSEMFRFICKKIQR